MAYKLFFSAGALTFLIGTLAAVWLFLDAEAVQAAAPVLVGALILVLYAFLRFARHNAGHIERVAKHRDAGALLALIRGPGRSGSPREPGGSRRGRKDRQP